MKFKVFDVVSGEYREDAAISNFNRVDNLEPSDFVDGDIKTEFVNATGLLSGFIVKWDTNYITKDNKQIYTGDKIKYTVSDGNKTCTVIATVVNHYFELSMQTYLPWIYDKKVNDGDKYKHNVKPMEIIESPIFIDCDEAKLKLIDPGKFR